MDSTPKQKKSPNPERRQNASVGRPALVLGQPSRSTRTNREQLPFSRSTGRSTVPYHGRPGEQPGHVCARRAHRSTGRSTGLVHRSTGWWTRPCPGLLQCLFLLPLTSDLCAISSISFISSLPTILHLGENFLNLSQTPTNTWRNRHTISA